MILNENIAPTLLVPYCPHHVSTYHQWMQNEETRSKTASELLTLEEEYANQLSWRKDPEKLTFIICLFRSSEGGVVEGEQPDAIDSEDDSPDTMVGDINLFLNDFDDDDDDDNDESAPARAKARKPSRLIGEINLMIARPEFRKQGLGRAALLTFLSYAWSNRDAVVKELELSRQITCELIGYQAKIDKENTASIRLFESIGFKRTKEEPNYFGEVELVLIFGQQGLLEWRKYNAFPYKHVEDAKAEN